MFKSTNINKELSTSPKTAGRFASPEEAARAKNVQLVAQIKKIGLKIIKTNLPSK